MTIRRTLSILAAAGALALGASACGGASGDCIVLANGGNEICNQQASAWCQATDPIRALDPTAAESAVSACATIEADYPNP